MRNVVAKNLKAFAFEQYPYDPAKRDRFYTFLKRRYTRTPRTEKKGFFKESGDMM